MIWNKYKVKNLDACLFIKVITKRTPFKKRDINGLIFLLLLLEDSFSIYKKIKSNFKLITKFILISNKINNNYLFTFFDLASLSKTEPLYK